MIRSIFGIKSSSPVIDISQYMDLGSNEILDSDLILVDYNELIHVYKRECEIPQFGVYFSQYYFRKKSDSPLKKLTKENLLKAYECSSCFMELQVFLISSNVVQLDKHGRLELLDIINSHTEKEAYLHLKRLTLLEKARPKKEKESEGMEA